jgi:hypothetical protein
MTKAAALLALPLAVLSGCVSASLEQIVENRRDARLQEVNAGRPLTHGAADGLGFSIADTAPARAILTERAELSKPNP